MSVAEGALESAEAGKGAEHARAEKPMRAHALRQHPAALSQHPDNPRPGSLRLGSLSQLNPLPRFVRERAPTPLLVRPARAALQPTRMLAPQIALGQA